MSEPTRPETAGKGLGPWEAPDGTIWLYSPELKVWNGWQPGDDGLWERSPKEMDRDYPMHPQPRCKHTSPTPWGPSLCALPDGHDGRHAYSPSEYDTSPGGRS